eukprot:GHVH01006340.1.p1 GENE.GHVH01006340.1~~GHVH01006340.1.p1  ORF type:complete len:369 (+),score=56.47 GHVH01006340.1:25-1107(+)
MGSTQTKSKDDGSFGTFLWSNYRSDEFAERAVILLNKLDPANFGGIRFQLLSSRFSLKPEEQLLLRRAARLLRREERNSPLASFFSSKSSDFIVDEFVQHVIDRRDSNTPYLMCAVLGDDVVGAIAFRLEPFHNPNSKSDQWITEAERLEEALRVQLPSNEYDEVLKNMYHILETVDDLKGKNTSPPTYEEMNVHSIEGSTLSREYFVDLQIIADDTQETLDRYHEHYTTLSSKKKRKRTTPSPLSYDPKFSSFVYRVFLYILDSLNFCCYTPVFRLIQGGHTMNTNSIPVGFKEKIITNGETEHQFSKVGDARRVDGVKADMKLDIELWFRRADPICPWDLVKTKHHHHHHGHHNEIKC